MVTQADADGAPSGPTRERILDVALDLFTSQGFDGTSMREIAGRLNIAKPSIYYHFAGKEEILLALHLRLHANYDDHAITRFEESYQERLAEMRRRDVFPEFDIPDLADLPGDESYDAELSLELAVELPDIELLALARTAGVQILEVQGAGAPCAPANTYLQSTAISRAGKLR